MVRIPRKKHYIQSPPKQRHLQAPALGRSMGGSNAHPAPQTVPACAAGWVPAHQHCICSLQKPAAMMREGCRHAHLLRMAGHPAFECQGPTLGTADLPAWRPAHLRLRVWKRGEPEVSQMPSDFLCPLGLPLFALLLTPPRPPLLLAPPLLPPLLPPAVASVLLWAPPFSAGPTTTSTCSIQCSASAQCNTVEGPDAVARWLTAG